MRPHGGSLILHQSQMHCLQIVSIGSLSTRGAACGAACHRVTGANSHKATAQEQFIPTASGTFQFVTVWCLWPRTYCWDSLLNSGHETTSHELAVCESDSRCSTWITTSGSALLVLTSAKQAESFLPKEEYVTMLQIYLFFFNWLLHQRYLDESIGSVPGVDKRGSLMRYEKSTSRLWLLFSISQEASLWSSECLPSKLTPSFTLLLSLISATISQHGTLPTTRQRAICLTSPPPGGRLEKHLPPPSQCPLTVQQLHPSSPTASPQSVSAEELRGSHGSAIVNMSCCSQTLRCCNKEQTST